MDGAEASRRVKEHALRLGFSHAGVAAATQLEEEGERLRQWLARGYHAGMHWMARAPERRDDPRQVLPGARAVVAVAANYHTPDTHSTDPRHGKISRYAWGDDYHTILGKRLEALQEWVEAEWPGERCRWYVDTGPVMEKAWAQRAGLGWVGKHTNLITADRGSWVFLGAMLTTLPLAPDEPATDHCGTCTLCLEACPTQALVEPYLLDGIRCISYLTIEHRDEIPESLQGRFENWIFGCDVCQDVCPWNRKFASPSGEEAFRPRAGFAAPDLDAWGAMSEREFDGRFAGSPVRRARREGLARNIAFVRRTGER